MSHHPERIEKNCLNCGNEVAGRYCQKCGQENIVTKQGFWSLTKHFVYDIFHFDGKFFDTLGHLLWRPGVISKEYVEGKRTKYLDPIRMYLFTSALFFLVLFALESNSIFNLKDDSVGRLDRSQRMDLAFELSGDLKKNPSDTILKRRLSQVLDSTLTIKLKKQERDTLPEDTLVSFQGKRYQFSAFHELSNDSSLEKSHGWFDRRYKNKKRDLKTKFGENTNESLEKLSETFRHKVPYLLFISLPFFAGILKLLYIRRRNFYYSDHAVFTLHHYILSFILLLVSVIFNYAGEKTGWHGLFSTLITITLCLWPVYLYIEMKRFYGQGWLKTLGKLVLLTFLGFIVIMILTIIFVVFSVYQI